MGRFDTDGIIRVCLHCEKEYQPKRLDQNILFCSRMCSETHQRTPDKQCLQCGKPFHAKDPNQKYCSQSCSASHNQNGKHRKPRTKECLICHKPILKGKFCSLSCMGAHQSSVRRYSLAEVMVENSTYARTNLKRWLIQDGILENKCHECGQLPIWNNKLLIMVLDHKNGIHNDHRLENLRLLCPNCNSQTETFSGKRKPYK